MSERRPQALEGRQSSNRSNTGGDRDTSSNDDQPHPVQQHQHHARKKQFFVGGAHTRHHIRVPSYGRNLNKLSKLTPLATSPVNKGRGTDAEKPRLGKRLMFEVGEDNGSRAGSYKEGGDADGNTDSGAGAVTATGGLVTSGAAPTKPSNGLAKSSSTKSLDRQLREGRRKTSRQAELSKRDRSGSRSRDRSTRPIPRQLSADNIIDMNSKRQPSQAEPQQKVPSQPPQQPAAPQPRAQHQSLAPLLTIPRLLPHTKPGAIPPQVNPESVTTITKIQHAPPQNAPITPAHSLPNSHDQHLTSRFADFPTENPNSFSPSSGAGAYTSSLPSRVEESTTTPTRLPETATLPSLKPSTSNLTSRTQQKLWLQWQSSQHESPQLASQNHRKGPGSEWFLFQSRVQKEFERVSREYMNTRRFSNPVADSFERTLDKNPDKRIPQKRNGEASGSMGLSQSLKETTAVKPFRRDGATTRDDSGVQQQGIGRIERADDDERVSGLESLLLKMWRDGDDAVSSNE